VEYLNLRVASIDDAITNAAYGISGCAGHTAIYLSHAHQASEKKNVPYLLLLGSRGCSRSEKNSWPNDPANNKCESPTYIPADKKLLLVNGAIRFG